jgi:hypothetical protein
LPTKASLKFYSRFTTNNHEEFMREKLALSSHQKNKRIFFVSHQPPEASGLQIISIFILFPLSQQLTKREENKRGS